MHLSQRPIFELSCHQSLKQCECRRGRMQQTGRHQSVVVVEGHRAACLVKCPTYELCHPKSPTQCECHRESMQQRERYRNALVEACQSVCLTWHPMSESCSQRSLKRPVCCRGRM